MCKLTRPSATAARRHQVTVGHPKLLVMQLCSRGSLLGVLRQASVNLLGKGATEVLKILEGYCVGVAQGMAHLAKQRLVHRDLASRNVLVDGTDTTKIADFGLSRSVAQTNEYYKLNNSEALLPFRWVPPENLLGGVSRFTQASDVWSYGVLCSEVWGLGATPYGELGMVEVIRYVQDGNILAKQGLCPAEFYNLVVVPCFAQMPDDRPSFTDLCTQFSNAESDYSKASTINQADARNQRGTMKCKWVGFLTSSTRLPLPRARMCGPSVTADEQTKSN